MAGLALGLGLGLGLGAAVVWAHRPPAPPGARARFPCRFFAHRGGCGERIENTLEAFEQSVARGAQVLELDVRRSRDGVVVVCHDRDLARETGVARDLRATDYADLPPYKDPLEVTFSPGSFASGSDHHIARLEDVFQRFPGVPVNIEVKEDDDELISKEPAMPSIVSMRRALVLVALFYLGLLPRTHVPEAFLQVPLPSIINRTYFPVRKGCLGALMAKMLQKVLMRKELFKQLQDKGVKVIMWVLNEDKDFAEAFGYGVDGVMTDYPTRLRRYLDQHPAHERPGEVGAGGQG
ncbi:lysophospholipase D GDPD3 isoform X2 [Alligator mississippiensis]|uniref:lysophospholipase D GDPD3 isoform X2 n=1 Tax=Alligator mississippiensis TaxID=8496 RepID=UPI0028774CB0|nr:lysophospholipase D GDPD3 isoform X2 [Alligator mississippiensis]